MMTRAVLGLLLAMLATGCTRPPVLVKETQPQIKQETSVEQMVASVPLVLYEGSAGAGVLFRDGDKIGMLTAAHLIEDEIGEKNAVTIPTYGTQRITVIGHEVGKEKISYVSPAVLVSVDPKHDWAVLEVTIPHDSMKFVCFGDRIPKIGEGVWMVGSPLIDPGTISRGIVCHPDRTPSLSADTGLRFIHTDAAGAQGSSGGGLFDENGVCIGIVVRRNPINGTMYAFSTYYIHEELHDLKLKPDPFPPFLE